MYGMPPDSNRGTSSRRVHRGKGHAAGRAARSPARPEPERRFALEPEAAPPATATERPGDVLERVSDAFVALDNQWRYTYVNRQAAELFGTDPEHLLGQHIWTVYPEGIGQPFQQAYVKAMAEQVFIQIESYYEPWDRWFENRIYPSAEGVSIFFHEITDRKRAEETARDNAALLELQNEVLHGVARGERLDRTLDVLLRGVESLMPQTWSSILLCDAEGEHIRALTPSLPEAVVRAIESGPAGPGEFARTILRREPVVVENVTTDPLWSKHLALATAHGISASYSTPIIDAEDRVLGTVALFFHAPGRPADRYGRLLETTVRTAALALTNQRQADARQASEGRLRLAVTGGNVGIWEWDVAANRVCGSDQLQAMFGWPAATAEVGFDAFLDAIHRDDRAAVEQALRCSVHWGVDYDVEYRIVRPDGAVRWIAAKGGAEYAGTSTPVRMMGVALDITDRKEAENDLRRSDERFQLVARATNDVIWDWDLVTGGTWWNQGITTLFGYACGEVGLDVAWRYAHIHPDDVDRVAAELRAVTATHGQFWSGEFRFRRSDGSFADVFDRGFLIYDNTGAPVRMIGAMADISERKRAVERLEAAVTTRTAELNAKNHELEEQISERRRVAELLRRRNEELKAFAYTVSHDLKAPLRGIAGYAQELGRRHRAGLDERGSYCVEQILTATRNLDRLIEDLLHYSRLDAETPAPTDIDLSRLIDRVIQDCNPAILKSQAKVTVDLGVTHMRAWERGLSQVVTNLVDNALKYSRGAAPPRVRIAVTPVGDAVRIAVSDNGIGFDMQYHDRIFGLFNRLVRQEDFEGTGAGLAITKKVLDKMNGSLWAESSPGAGATFFVQLPLLPPQDR
jgi:PAS domain S-box-containing protein